MKLTQQQVFDFYSKTDYKPSTGCMVWNKTINSNEDPLVKISGIVHFCLRVSYEIKNPPIPEGYRPFHTCNNRLCIAPSHIFIGLPLYSDQFDMVMAGNAPQKEDSVKKSKKLSNSTNWRANQAKAKINWDIVHEIRKLGKLGTNCTEISKIYPISTCQISKIINNKTWIDKNYKRERQS